MPHVFCIFTTSKAHKCSTWTFGTWGWNRNQQETAGNPGIKATWALAIQGRISVLTWCMRLSLLSEVTRCHVTNNKCNAALLAKHQYRQILSDIWLSLVLSSWSVLKIRKLFHVLVYLAQNRSRMIASSWSFVQKLVSIKHQSKNLNLFA